ncbi:MAG TPA: glycoside hydrolase family 71/99-like protein [Polyangia bacterium]|jgi:hypothetical protein
MGRLGRLNSLAIGALSVAACAGSGAIGGGNGGGGGAADAGAAGGTSGSGGVSGSGGSIGVGGAGGSGGAGADAAARAVVDASTLLHKFLMGYQGWFACPADGAPTNRWVHWFRSQTPAAANVTVDLWPDLTELADDELFATTMTLPGGQPARLYSAWTPATVQRHFRWMRDADLDGVMLQRFSSELGDQSLFAFRNQVTKNVRSGAEQYGRVFAVMYDVSGANAATLLDTLKTDWSYLVNTLKVTESDRYLRHQGKPLLAIWGLGFAAGPTAAQAQAIITYFKTGAPAAEQVTLLGGVPWGWRTLTNDARPEADWSAVYRSFDVLSPWTVGAFANNAGADNFLSRQVAPDLAAAQAAGIAYMPVVFPGFSWKNLKGAPSPLNQIPRQGGAFYWHQLDNVLGAGAAMLYGAMFDEVDEGTALFKVAATPAAQPAQGTFVPLNIDGQSLPSDWYLRLTGAAGAVLRGEQTRSSTIPITP